jgi:hypothetical protein
MPVLFLKVAQCSPGTETGRQRNNKIVNVQLRDGRTLRYDPSNPFVTWYAKFWLQRVLALDRVYVAAWYLTEPSSVRPHW